MKRKTLQPTPGPLCVPDTQITLNASNGCPILRASLLLIDSHRKNAANLRRLAACWNFFQGTSTEEIEELTAANNPDTPATP